MCIYIYIYMYVCMYVCMHACMYVCMYVCIRIHIYIYIYIAGGPGGGGVPFEGGRGGQEGRGPRHEHMH